MEALPDWDLLAVVRSCRATTAGDTSPSSQPPLPPPQPQREQQELCFSPTSVSSSSCSTSGMLFRFPNPFESATTSFQQDLQDICKLPLSCTTTAAAVVNPSFQQSSLSSPVSVSSTSSSFMDLRSFSIADQTQLRRPIKPSPPSSSQVVFGAPPATTVSQSQTQRTKKRKNLMKKVCHVPAEGLSSDMWAWRKYGQKPIKGSPYPRGYYRCSSSKGCLARKQVERNRSDPKMFIITYTAEHNHPMPTHRNSLAGSTRQKPLSSPAGDSLSPLTEKTEVVDLVKEEEEEEEDNEMNISELMLNDDFYVGFEQIDGDDDSGGDCFSDQFSPPMEMPWLSSSGGGTAAAAGGS